MGGEASGLLKFITCGSVDDGKSTLLGHILFDSKLLYADQEQALILDSRVGARGGDIDYSLLLDGLMAEREQGITIDVAYRYFTTERRSFIAADTPGHEEYTRNMAVGASFADLAVILIDASRGVLSQTRRHVRICALMGIRHFAFAVNKMDVVGFEKSSFDGISADIAALSRELGLCNYVVIPVSATEGDNVTKPSARTPWYNGETLLRHLETVDISAGAREPGFYLPVQRVARPDMTFRGFQGQIESGAVAVGDTVTALPSRQAAVVKSIYAADRAVASAHRGQPVTIALDREVDVSRGCVLTRGAELKTAKDIAAELLWMDDAPLEIGREYWAKIGTKLIPAVISRISYKVDVNSGEKLDAPMIAKNELALCDIALSQTTVVSEFSVHPTLGELILIDRVSHSTAACGVVTQISEKQAGQKSGGARFNTLLLHPPGVAGEANGATLPAIYQSVAFAHESAEKLEEVFAGRAPGFSYTRIGNPTVTAFERRIAAIEGGVAAVATSSGMAAISMALLNILQTGDEIISGTGLFGGTLDLLSDLAAFGITTKFAGSLTPGEIEPLITDRTKVIFAEMIGNPKLDVVNLAETSGIAKKYGIPLIIDSTTATPALIRPIERGADIVVHSSSKYINGSGNSISGVIVDGGKFNWDFAKFPALAAYRAMKKMAFTVRLRQGIGRNFGACLAPENAYLNVLGLETLGIRMERTCQNAKLLAWSLEDNPDVASVNYPGLSSSPYRTLVDSQMKNGMGGAIVTLRVGSRERAFKLINCLKYASIATNIGDVRTLVIHPASTIYNRSSDAQKASAGVYDDMIRVSVGLEDADDLIEDFAQAARSTE